MLASSELYIHVGYYHFIEFRFLYLPVSETLNEGVIVVLQELHVHVHCLLQCLLLLLGVLIDCCE